LCRRIKKNKTVNDKLELATLSDKAVFNKIFPQQVDLGKRKPQTWTWIMRRIRDGNDLKPPRNLIDLIEMARQAQLRREEREGRDLSNDPLIEPDALRRGLSQLSKERVLDTLLAEAGPYRDAIGRFRDGKAEHNTESLADVLSVSSDTVKAQIQPLLEIGFLEDVKGTYKVPSLYREGMGITQGKAFAADSSSGASDEDETEE
jgi:hypothetical protein